MKLTIPPNLSGLLRKYNDGFLADDSLSDLNVFLLSLYLIEHKTGKSGASYKDLKELFVSLGRKEDSFRKNLFGAKKQNLVEEKEEAICFRIDGLKRIEKAVGQTEKTPVYLIKSGGNFTAIKLFEEFLTSEINDIEILLCDPHISSSTLFPFSVLKNKVKAIKILCSNIYDHEKFLEYKKKFMKEMNIPVETKVNNKIHDRYLICGKKCWSIGTSIKDLGNKDTIIRELDEVENSLKELFTERWNEAS
ncbi:MAG: hypothetical protein WCE94_13805 [Candidatus Methanoperedens sp.]